MKFGISTNHEESLAAYRAAGFSFPTIPKGKNTVWYHFTTAEGRPAVIVNQSGFAQMAGDDENPVNGCSLVVVLDEVDPKTARPALERWLDENLPTSP